MLRYRVRSRRVSGWAIVAPTALAAALAAAYLIWTPPSQDLAASTFRAELFAEHGFALWNNQWYSGHHLLSYSVLYPPLAAALSPEAVGAIAVVAAAAIFAALAGARFGARALLPALWFAAGAASWLLTGRMPFLLALPFGLGALLAADRDRPAIGALLAALCSLASPVGGLFVGLAGVAIGLAGERARGAWLAIGAAVPIVVLNLAFPVGGEEPFVFDAFIAVPLLAVAVVWLVPPEFRALRIGVLLYAALALAVFVIPNALGGNVTRLGALLAGPVLALVLWPRGRLVVAAVAIPLLYWQLIAPVRDVAKATGDPATERSFYEPLLAELRGLSASRIQIPPTLNRWEATYVAREQPIARGWLRQLESDDFELFTDGNLTPDAYREWLDEHHVSYVAVPEAELDYLAEDEVELIDSGLDYLEPVWENEDWRLYRVDRRSPTGTAAAGTDWFEIDPSRTGEYRVGIEYTRWWRMVEGSGCVSEAEDGATVVEARAPGPIRVEARLDGDSCSG
jgi:hypothetical protein